ncbi:DUF1801 domain-containing protein [Streptomyces sp. NPDC051940]|uniref:iron chaperone n=1 Tax=Streptomyces sp. NPDC051940 TaxID=3155675 RepID=UPI00341E0A90
MTSTDSGKHEGFSADERAAMKDHAKELKAEARRGSKAEKAEQAKQDLLAKIAEMGDADRALAERIHAVVTENAPDLAPKLWYGMPAYWLDGKNVLFFQPADKFKARYATLGFNDPAKLDDGAMWPVAYAVTEVTPEVEKQIVALVRKAVG